MPHHQALHFDGQLAQALLQRHGFLPSSDACCQSFKEPPERARDSEPRSETPCQFQEWLHGSQFLSHALGFVGDPLPPPRCGLEACGPASCSMAQAWPARWKPLAGPADTAQAGKGPSSTTSTGSIPCCQRPFSRQFVHTSTYSSVL